MAVVDFSAHVTNPIAAGPASAPAAAASSDEGFSFDDLIDIVNPLQHIPIVGTLYRAITGDHIKTFPKIAGDTLYGGVTGFFSSVADTIFEKITGKNVGDTILSWVESEFSGPATAVASAAPAAAAAALPPAAPAAVAPAALDSIVIPGQDALLMALTRNGIDSDIALRAATAYRSTLNLASSAASTALH